MVTIDLSFDEDELPRAEFENGTTVTVKPVGDRYKWEVEYPNGEKTVPHEFRDKERAFYEFVRMLIPLSEGEAGYFADEEAP